MINQTRSLTVVSEKPSTDEISPIPSQATSFYFTSPQHSSTFYNPKPIPKSTQLPHPFFSAGSLPEVNILPPVLAHSEIVKKKNPIVAQPYHKRMLMENGYESNRWNIPQFAN